MSQKNFTSYGDMETLVTEIVSKISGKVDKVSGKGLSTNDYTTADKNKVDALKSASTKDVPTSGNASSSQVVMGNDSRLTDSRNAKDVYPWAKAATKPTYTANEVGAIPATQKGTASGVAELDANGKVPSSQLPSYVDDTVDGYLYNSKWYSDEQHTHEVTGESGKIYVELSTNKTYRWSGSGFVEISESLALGETSSTAYRGDRGKTAYDHSQLTSGNPHNVTKANVGLSNVPNVSTNDQTPTFSVASTRANIVSGDKLSVIMGKIQKFFNDLKTVAFSGSYTDLTNQPQINGNTLTGNKTAGDLGLQSELTFDNAPTDGSNNPVKSDGIYDSEKDIYAVMGQMGAKNLLYFPYDDSDGKVDHNVTYTVNNDGTVSAIGKCDNRGPSNFFFDKYSSDQMWIKPGRYIFSGAPEGNTEGYIWCRIYHSDNTNTLYSATAGSFIFDVVETDINIRCGIAFNSNTGDDNVSRLFKPMIRKISDTDDTYQPYAKTNKQLTDAVSSILTEQDSIETELDTKADKTATASGETLALVPTSEGRALLHTAYGMSVQNGTPTPSNPVDIVSAKADFRSVGKNLNVYPYKDTTKTSNNVTFTDNGDGTVTVSTTSAGASGNVTFACHTRTPEDVNDLIIKNGKYILTGCPSGGSDSKYRITTGCIKNGGFQSLGIDYGEGVVVTADGDDYSPNGVNIQITIDIRNGCVLTTPITFKPMLRLADVTDGTYEPYTKHDVTTDLTLRAIEVTSSDAYNLVRDGKYYIADTLDYSEDNGFVVTRRVGEKIYDGSEDEDWKKDSEQYGNGKFIGVPEANQWTTANVAYTAFMQNLSDIKLSRTAYYTTPFVVPAFAMFKSNSLNMQGLAVRTVDTVEMGITEFKTWLSTNNIQLDYILATPTTETITTTQALALLGLKTYDESTTISSQAEPACTVAVEYAKERLGAVALTAYNTAGMPDTYPAEQVMMSDGVTSVEDALDDMQAYETLTKADLIDESIKNASITLTTFSIEKIKGLPIGRLIIVFKSTSDFPRGARLGMLKSDIFAGTRPIAYCVNNSDRVPGGTIFVNPPSQAPVEVYQITANKIYNAEVFVMLKS